ncbi:hypothetical protein C1I95_01220 [Micromonospora craterilacus]|uniref:Uncharacterized protein n=1 Tax=Micromonospora craterilacus TaxID=1655439 RepID=A0A2W2FFB9_9ACTN|nr:hypothetical protein C1I95_01220 [Micromonospora craterilacus]
MHTGHRSIGSCRLAPTSAPAVPVVLSGSSGEEPVDADPGGGALARPGAADAVCPDRPDHPYARTATGAVAAR